MSLRQAHRIHVQQTTKALSMEIENPQQVHGDLTTHMFTDAAIEIMAMSDAEFQARLPEFGFAAAAIVSRIAKCAQ